MSKNFRMKKQHYDRAEQLLKEWGANIRLEWAPPNGLTAPQINKVADTTWIAPENIKRMNAIMDEMKVSINDSYEFCKAIYYDRRDTTSFPKTIQKRIDEELKYIQKWIFVKMWPEETITEDKAVINLACVCVARKPELKKDYVNYEERGVIR